MHSMRIDSIWPQVWPWGAKGCFGVGHEWTRITIANRASLSSDATR